MERTVGKRGKLLLGVFWAWILLLPGTAFAATTPPPAPTGNFNLQVSPSPLVATVKPGVKSQIELKIHNQGTGTEYLQIEPRNFTFDSKTGKVNLQDTVSPAFSKWITFSAQKFTVASDQTFSEQVIMNVPKDAGFSYSFALVITRQNNPAPQPGTRAITGSLAVFSLINIDRPGATSNLKVSSFSTSKKLYEYLPASISIRFNNVGNTIVQPAGNIFIARGSNAATPLATLDVNPTQGYILSGTQRTVTATWSDGFPVYKTTTDASGKATQHLVWNWGDLSKLRIGRYTAHLVAVYSQDGRDVPIEGTVSFWVIPWKILLVVLLVILLILFAVFMMVRSIVRGIKGQKAKRTAKKEAKKTPPEASQGE